MARSGNASQETVETVSCQRTRNTPLKLSAAE